jgi:3'-phosphoadenosine 5'-phosphosulfate sulfotransferase (PAPS reductase)/FAD synthetase
MNNLIVSVSEGKDSLATVLGLIERGEPVHSAIHVSTGWEFPEMHDHVARVAAMLESHGVQFVHFNLKHHLHHIMFHRPVFGVKAPHKGKLRYIGRGWPSPVRRWCTAEKVGVIDRYIKQIDGAVSCIGFAADEAHRADSKNIQKQPYHVRFPLIEWGMTEADALAYCRERGFYPPGSPYDHFSRVSCYCCPLQGLNDFRTIRKVYPDLWVNMLAWDARMPEINGPYWNGLTVRDLDNRFAEEDRLIKLPGMAEAI